MNRPGMGLIVGAALLVTSAAAGAQRRGAAVLPAGFMPPAGMCRVWIDGVPAGRQAAPTTCERARANVRANSRLVFGRSLRPNEVQRGVYDPRNGTYDPRNGTYDPRNGGYENGRDVRDDDRLSDKERRKLDKERRKEERERNHDWKQSHKRDNDDGDDDDDDDNDDGDGQHGRRGQHGQHGGWNNGGRGRDHDDGDNRDRNRGARDQQNGGTRGVYDGRGTNNGTWGRPGDAGRTQCVDANHDGICDNQPGMRVRVP